MAREWSGTYRGHGIRIVNRRLRSLELHIDGQLLDRRSPLLASDRSVPLLTGVLPGVSGAPTLIEVYVSSPLVGTLRVRADGTPVACAAVDAASAAPAGGLAQNATL